MQKWFIFLRRSHVDATWHSGPHGSATRAHAAPMRRIYIFIITYIIYNGYSAFRISEGFSILINPTISSILFRVGLIHTMCLKCRWRGCVRCVGSSTLWKSVRRSRGARTTDCYQNSRGILKALWRLWWLGADRISAIRSRSKGQYPMRFITIIYAGSSRLFIKIGRPRLKRNGPRWTVPS